MLVDYVCVVNKGHVQSLGTMQEHAPCCCGQPMTPVAVTPPPPPSSDTAVRPLAKPPRAR